jgi:hypothetical protein
MLIFLGLGLFAQLAKELALPHILSFNQSSQIARTILYILFPLNLFEDISYQRQSSFMYLKNEQSNLRGKSG